MADGTDRTRGVSWKSLVLSVLVAIALGVTVTLLLGGLVPGGGDGAATPGCPGESVPHAR